MCVWKWSYKDMEMSFFHIGTNNKKCSQENRETKRLAAVLYSGCWVRFHQRASRALTSKSGHMIFDDATLISIVSGCISSYLLSDLKGESQTAVWGWISSWCGVWGLICFSIFGIGPNSIKPTWEMTVVGVMKERAFKEIALWSLIHSKTPSVSSIFTCTLKRVLLFTVSSTYWHYAVALYLQCFATLKGARISLLMYFIGTNISNWVFRPKTALR